MKQVTFTQHFKVTQASNKSAKPEQLGKKRESIAVQYAAFAEPADYASLESDQICLVLNNAIETYAKKLILQNGSDWDYVPSESDLTIPAVYADLTAERVGASRTLTKESLASFATHYAELAVSFLGKSEVGANSGAQIIKLKLAPILGNNTALNTFMGNLEQILDCPEFDPAHMDVVTALLELISGALDQEISLDAL